jgi:hypothetical protein
MSDRTVEDALRAMLRAAAPPVVPSDMLDRASAIPTTVVAGRPWPARSSFHRGAVASAGLVTVVVLASVALLGLRAVPPHAGAPTSPLPSASTGGSVASGELVRVCNDLPHSYKGLFIPFLTCEGAISAALNSLPLDHRPIAKVEFGFGDYCRATAPCATTIDLLSGYVVVSYATGLRDLILVRDESAQSGVSVSAVEPLP